MVFTRNHILASALLFAIAAGCAATSKAPKGPAAAPPTSPSTPSPPGVGDTAAAVDAILHAEWTKAGVQPAAPIDDDTFLRRAYLDVLGVIPPPDAFAAFEADKAPDKRAKLVAALLTTPRYAEHWAVYWDQVLMKDEREARIDRAAFRAWLRDRLASNTGWDRIVYDLVSASGRNSEGGSLRQQDYGFAASDARMAAATDDDDDAGDAMPVNAAVNFPLKYLDAPQDFAGAASRTFLGVQIQCAQCHDHKTEKWKQTDFQSFAASFSHTQVKVLDKGNTMGGVRRMQIRDIDRVPQRFARNQELSAIVRAKPRALDGQELAGGRGAREAMAAWITSKDNPWFSRAIVNRMWARFLGRGFVDPIDDFRPSNPPAASQALDRLANDFVAHGYDLRWLIATITATNAYQRSAAPTPTSATAGDVEHKLFARFRMQPMAPDELLDSILQAAGLEQAIERTKVDRDRLRAQLARQYAFLFDVDEEFDHDAYEGTIAQALTLLNGSLTGSAASALPGGALEEVLSQNPTDAAKIDALYVRTLARHPSPEETAFWTRYVADGTGRPKRDPDAARRAGGDALLRLAARDANIVRDPKTRAYEDLLWALLNSSEFVLNH